MPFADWRQLGERCEESGPHIWAIGGVNAGVQACCYGTWGYYEVRKRDWDGRRVTVVELRRIADRSPSKPYALVHYSMTRKTPAEWERDPHFQAAKRWEEWCRTEGPHYWPVATRGGGSAQLLKPCCENVWQRGPNGWKLR